MFIGGPLRVGSSGGDGGRQCGVYFARSCRFSRAAKPENNRKLWPLAERNASWTSHASHIIGWSLDEGRALLDELLAFATQPRFVSGHKWRIGVLVIGDNRCTMHRASPFESKDYKREMRRTSIVDTRGDRSVAP
jgi:hypothetical protein